MIKGESILAVSRIFFNKLDRLSVFNLAFLVITPYIFFLPHLSSWHLISKIVYLILIPAVFIISIYKYNKFMLLYFIVIIALSAQGTFFIRINSELSKYILLTLDIVQMFVIVFLQMKIFCEYYKNKFSLSLLIITLILNILTFFYIINFIVSVEHSSKSSIKLFIMTSLCSLYNFLFITILIFRKKIKLFLFDRIKNDYTKIALYSSVLLLILIGFYIPTKIYVSDIQAFSSQGNILLQFLLTFIFGFAFVSILMLLFILLRKEERYMGAMILCWITFIVLSYCFIIDINYGYMEGLEFRGNVEKMYLWSNILIDIAVFVVTAFFLYMLLRFCGGWIITILLIAEIGACSVMGVYHIYNIQSQINTLSQQDEQSLLPKYADSLFSFSKNKINVLILMLDSFTGDHFNKILTEHPDIASSFTGFTYYFDCISAGAATNHSAPSIMGGVQATPAYINRSSSSSDMSILNQYAKAAAYFPSLLKPQNFQIDYLNATAGGVMFKDKIRSFTDAPINLEELPFDGFAEFWKKKTNFPGLINGRSTFQILPILSIFRILPLTCHQYIYDAGNWNGIMPNDYGAVWTMYHYSSLDSIRYLLNTNSKQNTFKFFEMMFPHIPWAIDHETLLPSTKYYRDFYSIKNGEVWKQNEGRVNGIYVEHYYAELAAVKALQNLFSKMKKLGIYDNTMIVVVSDHDSWDSITGYEMAQRVGNNVPISRFNSLLLVKNINQHHNLIIDYNKLMMSSDVMQIIFNELNKYMNVDYPIREPWENSNRIRYHVWIDWTHWLKQDLQKSKLLIQRAWRCVGAMTDERHWTQLSNSEAQSIPDLDEWE